MNYFVIYIERRRMIQTSYYQKSGSLPNAVGISQGVPKWYKGELYKKLAPPWEIVKIENGHIPEALSGNGALPLKSCPFG